jgi:DNA polymerase III epsilon subunit-like protein
LELDIHKSILKAFAKHSYDYNSIAQETKYSPLSISIVAEHIKNYITFNHLVGYELPPHAYPVPFDLNEGNHVTYMLELIATLRVAIENNKQVQKRSGRNKKSTKRIHSYFYTNNMVDCTSNLCQHFEDINDSKLLKDLDLSFDSLYKAVKHIYTVGICCMKVFCENYLYFTNYRAERSRKYIEGKKNGSIYLSNILKVYHKSNRYYIIIKRKKDQDQYEKWLKSEYKQITHEEKVDKLEDKSFNSHRLVIGLKKIIKEGKWDDTFLMARLECIIDNMQIDDKRLWRFKEVIKIYAQSRKNYLGKRKYQALLGPEEDKTNVGKYDKRKVNDVLPSASILDKNKGSLITEMGVYPHFIKLCSQLLSNLKGQLSNLWEVMVDSVDLQVNLTVFRSNGLIYGVAGKVYKISEVQIEPIFKRLNAMKHLARKATVVLLCHAGNSFSIVAGCNTCVSEKNSEVAELLRDTVQECRSNGVNVQVLNSDGANYEAVKTVATEFDISAVNCSCHLAKNVRNVLLADVKYNRTILMPLKQVQLISDPTQYNCNIYQPEMNMITVEIDDVEESFKFQIKKGSTNSDRVLFQANICKSGTYPFFDPTVESGWRIVYDNDEKETKFSIRFSIFIPRHNFQTLTVKCTSTTATIKCTGHIVQKISMDTIRKTYEGDLDVQNVISWETMHVRDKMNESLMAQLCSDQYLEVLHKKYPLLPGLHNYLTMMRNIYYPASSGTDIRLVKVSYLFALKTIEQMRELTQYLDGLYGVTDATYKSLKLNVDGVDKLITYINKNPVNGKPIEFCSRLLLTNRLEGLFGRARLIMRRFTHFQFMFILTKLVDESLYFLHPKKKHTDSFGKKCHYLSFKDDNPTNRIECEKLFNEYMQMNRGQKIHTFTNDQLAKAMELARAFHMPKVKIIRDSYYGAKYNDIGKFEMMRNKPAPLDATVIQEVHINYFTNIPEIEIQSTSDFELEHKFQQLFERNTTEYRSEYHVSIVYMDMEWNQQGEIISIGCYHVGSKKKFYSLAKQRNAGRTSIHKITTDDLKSAPALQNVLYELVEWLAELNTPKVLLVAHFGLGADFPKLFKALHSCGVKIPFAIELADSRYVFQYAFNGEKITLKLEELYKRIKPDGTYNKHNALADTEILQECTWKLVTKIKDHESDECVYNHLVWCQPKDVKEAFYRLIHNDESVVPDNYMVVDNDNDNTGVCNINTGKKTTRNRKNKTKRKSSTGSKIPTTRNKAPAKKRPRIIEEFDASESESDDEILPEHSQIQRKSTRTQSQLQKNYAFGSDEEEDFDDYETSEEDNMQIDSDLDMHDDFCCICRDPGYLVMCDGCDNSCHLECMDPPRSEDPEGDWFCNDCMTMLGLCSEIEEDEIIIPTYL